MHDIVIQYDVLSDNTIGTSLSGLVKSINEDRLACWKKDDFINACITDGHWGEEAAQGIIDFWRNRVAPMSKAIALKQTCALEKELYELFGKPVMDENKDRTPEAAFTAVRISGSRLYVTSYGDCRLLIINNEHVRYCLEQKSTWLGAFSYLKLRNRLSAHEGMVYNAISLKAGDYVIMFTDGLDECVYETPTMSNETIADSFKLSDPRVILEDLLSKAFSFGAEDNISIWIHKY